MQANEETAEDVTSYVTLFFDMALVLVVTNLSDFLTGTPSIRYILITCAVAVPIWWAWVGFSFFTARFSQSNPSTSILLISAALLATTLATTLDSSWNLRVQVFFIAFAGMRWCLVLMYAFAAKRTDSELAWFYAKGFGVAAAIATVCVILPKPWCFVVFFVGLVISILLPVLAGRLKLLSTKPINPQHLTERFNLLFMIGLGTALFCVGEAIANSKNSSESFTLGALYFALITVVFWRFFAPVGKEFKQHEVFTSLSGPKGGRLARDLYSYGQFPGFFGVVLISASVKVLISEHDAALNPTISLIVALGLLCVMLSILAIDITLWNRIAGWKQVWIIPAIALALLLFNKSPVVLLLTLIALTFASGIQGSRMRAKSLRNINVTTPTP